ncbi:NTP/NDP exchange transporter [Abyssalbus ytuae]|uniref:ADP,ATP carrier protein n=1 Tax=Abyssalbus ytuae TaxID=2926907 RepID=A0A9E6ZW61_9FLAO|nr:Npt1/Npt2 family nucleotide transporter [Abyssalbus ytuae]UOB17911.1 MFS transporter [Abyssalbus ytuae]
MIRNLFKKAFDIREGEIRISFLMQFYIFLLISVLLIVKPTVNALFLSGLGARHLPYAYILMAFFAIVSSYFYNKAVRHFSFLKITITTLVCFGLAFVLLTFLLDFSLVNDVFLYVYYLGVSLFAVLATSQFWMLANMVYNVREAKRLFGFIGAGAIAGGIFGGYLTTVLSSLFGTRIVIMVAAMLILSCIPLVQVIWRLRVKKLSAYIQRQRKGTDSNGYKSSLQLIINSKHLTYLAYITGVGVLIAKLVDFQFSDFAHNAIPDPDSLASFFGFWFSTFNVIALVIQLFLTNRIVGYFGVASSLLILPLSIALGCLLFLTFPELWVLIIIKGIDSSFKQSLSRAAIELSVLPIPYHIKSQAKSYIDVVVDSVATGIAGLLLIFLIKRMDLSTSFITVIVLLFIFLWIVLIYRLREAYFDSFRINLKNSLIANENKKEGLKKDTSLKSALRVFKNGTEDEILFVLENINSFRLKSLKQRIINLLNHPSSNVKTAVIEQLYFYDKGTAIGKIKDIVHTTKNDGVVFAAMQYLILHTDLKDDNIFNLYLDHKNDYIANAALLCLAKEASNNNKIALKYDLNSRIENKLRKLENTDHPVREEEIANFLITLGYAQKRKYLSFISAHFNNKSPYIVKHAIKAAGLTAEERFISILMDFVGEKKYRKPAIKALKRFGQGITLTLAKYVADDTVNDNIKQYIPRIVEEFRNQNSVFILFNLMRSKDIIIRLQASKSLNKLQKGKHDLLFDQKKLIKTILRETAYYRNTINSIASIQNEIKKSIPMETTNDKATEIFIAREGILTILQQQLEHSLQTIFKLLSLKYERTDMDVAYYGLKSGTQEAKVHAVEFLDNLLHVKLKTAILPLVEHHIIDNESYQVSSFKLTVLSEKECLLMLIKNRGKRIKLSVLNLIEQLGNTDYVVHITPLLKHKNPEIRFFAQKTIERLMYNASA